jgi:hypothetical protein
MQGAYCSLLPVGAFHRPAGRIHIRFGVVTEVAGEVVSVVVGLWRRVVGWDGVLALSQYVM